MRSTWIELEVFTYSAISCHVLHVNLCWDCEFAPDIFLLIYFSKSLSVQTLVVYSVKNYMCVSSVCEEKDPLSFIHSHCHFADG